MTATKTKTKTYTVASLAEEVGMYLDDLIPLLGKLGMKNATADQSVKPAIAQSVKRTVEVHNNSLQKQLAASPKQQTPVDTEESQQDEPGGEIELKMPEKLKLKEVKGVAEQAGVTQTFVKDLSLALYNRKMDLLVQQGIEQYRREKEALEAGKLYAQVEDLQALQQEVLDMEEGLYKSQAKPRTEELLLGNNCDLQSLIDAIQTQQEDDAKKRVKRKELIEKIEKGEELTEEELIGLWTKK
ncbi:MAG: hypothetical protein F6K14_26825 [Symploca sp. SIO2C1]|nr:hypothetical protein [Symploca sp. SIO2C1]